MKMQKVIGRLGGGPNLTGDGPGSFHFLPRVDKHGQPELGDWFRTGSGLVLMGASLTRAKL